MKKEGRPMNEAAWLACDDPVGMLVYLGDEASQRKRQLFALACCQLMRSILNPELEILEALPEDASFVEDDTPQDVAWIDVETTLANYFWDSDSSSGSTEREFRAAFHSGTESEETDWSDSEAIEAGATLVVVDRAIWQEESMWCLWHHHNLDFSIVEIASRMAANAKAEGDEPLQVLTERWRLLAGFLCDIFGNPFRQARVAPAWLSPTTVALAQAIYEDRAFDRLPILADALEDAGCTDQTILDHLRGPGPHTRGCFALDLVLGKS
jgi:hypothetical protein